MKPTYPLTAFALHFLDKKNDNVVVIFEKSPFLFLKKEKRKKL